MSKKKFNKVIILYTDGSQYTIKNVSSVSRDAFFLRTINTEKDRIVDQAIPVEDVKYAIFYDNRGDVRVFNFTDYSVDVELRDRAYVKAKAKAKEALINYDILRKAQIESQVGLLLGEECGSVFNQADALAEQTANAAHTHTLSAEDLPKSYVPFPEKTPLTSKIKAD